MGKLNQIIAIEKGIKSRAYSEISEIHKANQKPELFNGFDKTYQPKDEAGEPLPPERKLVANDVRTSLVKVKSALGALMDVTARKDWSNCHAKADVKVGSDTILSGAPVSFLLFLEKQLTDIRTLVAGLPILDPGEAWTFDDASGTFKSQPIQTHRTKKVSKPIVLYPATEQHPAQTQIATEDVIAGFWTQVKMSGAMPKVAKEALALRVETLLRSVKEAREAANTSDEVPGSSGVSESVFNYLFSGG